MTDPYSILGVDRNASEDEIKKLGEEVQKLTDKYIKDVDKRI